MLPLLSKCFVVMGLSMVESMMPSHARKYGADTYDIGVAFFLSCFTMIVGCILWGPVNRYYIFDNALVLWKYYEIVDNVF